MLASNWPALEKNPDAAFSSPNPPVAEVGQVQTVRHGPKGRLSRMFASREPKRERRKRLVPYLEQYTLVGGGVETM